MKPHKAHKTLRLSKNKLTFFDHFTLDYLFLDRVIIWNFRIWPQPNFSAQCLFMIYPDIFSRSKEKWLYFCDSLPDEGRQD